MTHQGSDAMTIERRELMLAGAATALGLAAGLTTLPAAAQSAEEQAVGRAVQALTKGMLEVDRAQLAAITAEGLSYGHSAGRIENKAQFIDNIMARNSMFRRIELSDQTISIVGTDAIVRHLFVGETVNPAGQVSPVRIGVLQVWVKQGSDWKLLARQAYRV
jgi:hypothetical protein